MTFIELVMNRQSTRSYIEKSVEPEKIKACLEAARFAPSACNSQPWKFIVVDEKGKLEQVADAASGPGINKFLSQAPVVVAVVLEKGNISSRLGGLLKDKDYTLMDIGIAVEHISLQATELGLGSCIIGWFDEKKVKKVLSVPASKRVELLIALGYTDINLRKKTRKAFEEIVSFNCYT